MGTNHPLVYSVIAECKNSKARVGKIVLRHGEVDTPVFMPVGTQVNLIPLCNKIVRFHSFVSGNIERCIARTVKSTWPTDNVGKYISFGNQTC